VYVGTCRHVDWISQTQRGSDSFIIQECSIWNGEPFKLGFIQVYTTENCIMYSSYYLRSAIDLLVHMLSSTYYHLTVHFLDLLLVEHLYTK